MNSYHNDPRRTGRIFVYRYSGARVGWLTKLLALSAVVAVIGLVLLLALGLWVVLAISAGVVALGALVSALIPWRRREPPTGVRRVLEGEARRIDVDK